jgi:hypothetical protein
MRKITKSIATLAMAGALLTPAVATANPATATEQNGLVNVYVEDVLTHNQTVILQNVAIPVAAGVCGIDVNVLSAQLQKDKKSTCPALATAGQIGGVKY